MLQTIFLASRYNVSACVVVILWPKLTLNKCPLMFSECPLVGSTAQIEKCWLIPTFLLKKNPRSWFRTGPKTLLVSNKGHMTSVSGAFTIDRSLKGALFKSFWSSGELTTLTRTFKYVSSAVVGRRNQCFASARDIKWFKSHVGEADIPCQWTSATLAWAPAPALAPVSVEN